METEILKRRIGASILLGCFIWGLLAFVGAHWLGVRQMQDLATAMDSPAAQTKNLDVVEILHRPIGLYLIIFFIPCGIIACEYQAIETFLIKKLRNRVTWKRHVVRRM